MIFALQTLTGDALQPRIRRVERPIDHRIDTLAETFVLKSHALGECPEQVDVGATLAQRLDRLRGDLEIVVSVRALQVFVLEERCRGQNDVGVVRRVGEKLFVNDRKQVRPLQSADDFVAVRANRGRIGAVDEQRLDRRSVQRVQGRRRVATC